MTATDSGHGDLSFSSFEAEADVEGAVTTEGAGDESSISGSEAEEIRLMDEEIENKVRYANRSTTLLSCCHAYIGRTAGTVLCEMGLMYEYSTVAR